MIRVKRAYDPPAPDDGRRILVDRLWPRGMKKESLPLAAWLRDVAPSSALRQWFGHDTSRWEEFCRRYAAELAEKRAAWQPLLETARGETVTLLFSAHDGEHNNAAALKAFLEARLTDDGGNSGK